jgi:hypothetical protein
MLLEGLKRVCFALVFVFVRVVVWMLSENGVNKNERTTDTTRRAVNDRIVL